MEIIICIFGALLVVFFIFLLEPIVLEIGLGFEFYQQSFSLTMDQRKAIMQLTLNTAILLSPQVHFFFFQRFVVRGV